MPQVASDPKVHAPNLHMPRVTRPAPSDRAPSPFESLIEDTSQPPEAAPPQQDTKVAKSDDKQAPAKSKDCKAAEPNDDTKPANTNEVTTADEGPADESTAKVDGKKIAKPVGDVGDVSDVGDSIQAKADPEPDCRTEDRRCERDDTGRRRRDCHDSSDTISIVSSACQTPNETPDDGKQVEQPLQQLALVADVAPKINQLGADLPKAVVGKKADDGKAKQVDADDQVKTDQPTAETDDAFQILTKDADAAARRRQAANRNGRWRQAPCIAGSGRFHNTQPSSRRGRADSAWRRRQRCRENIERRSDATPDSQQRPSRIGKCRSAGHSCFAARPTAGGYSAVRSRHRDCRQGACRQEPFRNPA